MNAALRATPPATPAPAAAGEAGERGWYMRHAREALDKANAPTALPANRERWGLILASLMTGVLEEAEALHQEAARLQQELAEARAGWPISSPLLWKIAERIADRIHQAVKLPEHQAPHIDWDDVSNDWWNYLDEMLRPGGSPDDDRPTPAPPATPEAREAGGEEGGGHG